MRQENISTFYISAKYKNEGEGEGTQKVECEGERLRRASDQNVT